MRRPSAKRVLLVDDHDGARRAVAELLAAAGYEVEQAASPEDATASYRQGDTYDIVVTDVVMPSMSGPELAEWLQLAKPGVPVLFISGYVDDRVLPYRLERSQFLQKPFSFDEFQAKLRDLVG